jgi:hypothetical protein
LRAQSDQLRNPKQRYQTEIAELKAENNTLEQALAAAHGELNRLFVNNSAPVVGVIAVG